MSAAYIEYRSNSRSYAILNSSFLIIVNGVELHGSFASLELAKDFACNAGYHPVFVFKHQDFQDRNNPDNWDTVLC